MLSTAADLIYVLVLSGKMARLRSKGGARSRDRPGESVKPSSDLKHSGGC